MTNQEINPIIVCIGPACGLNWYGKWEKDPKRQGTGSLCKDIEEVVEKENMKVEVKSMHCQEMCPTGGSGLPGPTVFVGPAEEVVERPSSYSNLREWLRNLPPKKS